MRRIRLRGGQRLRSLAGHPLADAIEGATFFPTTVADAALPRRGLAMTVNIDT
jgi:hypothetical protein